MGCDEHCHYDLISHYYVSRREICPYILGMTVLTRKVNMKDRFEDDRQDSVEFSVLMPCLNEAEMLGACLRKAGRSLEENDAVGEIIIADNGSTDGSREIAEQLGAR